VAALAAEVVERFGPSAHNKGIDLSIRQSPEPFYVVADPGRVDQVLMNLIGNALKHGRAGDGVTTIVQVSAQDAGRFVEFAVADNGPGIAPEYHEVIFHKFERAKTPHAPRVRSSGLGLAFCRLVVEAHGGRIWVDSELGAGSAFRFALPLADVEA
jgi:signal transduction histidine kinase